MKSFSPLFTRKSISFFDEKVKNFTCQDKFFMNRWRFPKKNQQIFLPIFSDSTNFRKVLPFL